MKQNTQERKARKTIKPSVGDGSMKYVLALLLCAPVFGASCVSNGNGSTLTAANWTSCGGGVPGNGDTMTITHTMTLAGSQIVGLSLSGWQVTFNATLDLITCVQAGCTFANGQIVTYVRSATFAAGSVYPTGAGAGPGARSCVTNLDTSGPTPTFQLLQDNCGGSLVNITGNGTGTFYMREYTPAIQINSPGSLTVQSGGDLIIRGDVRFGNPNTGRDLFVVNGGGRVEWDSSQATNPNMTSYYMPAPSATLTQGSRVRFEGTAGNLATITSSTANGALPAARHINGTYDGTYGGDLFIDYADLSCLGLSSGTSGNQIVTWWNAATGSVSVKHTVLHTCSGGTTVGPIGSGTNGSNGVATNQYTFEDNQWLDGVDGCIGYDVSTTNAPTGAGTRSVKRNYMTCRFGDSNFPAFRDLEMEHNVFVNNAPALNLTGANVWNYSRYNIYINSDVNAAAGIGMFSQAGQATVHHLILYHRTCGNVRGFTPSSGTADGQIYEYIYAQCAQGTNPSDGDIFMSAGGGTSTVLRNFIIAPVWNAPGGPKSSGGLGTGGSNIRPWTIHNGIWYNCPGRTTVGNVTGCSLITAESGDGVAGMIANYQGNLIYGDTSFSTNSSHGTGTGTTGGAFPSGGRIVTNTFAAAGANWNGCFIKGGSCNSSSVYGSQNNAAAPPWNSGSGVTLDNFGTHYDVPMTGGTVPGANDMNGANPYFSDPRRTMEQWAARNGQTADVAGVTAYWQSIAPADLPIKIPQVFNWLFAGWTPFNIKYAQPGSPANGKYLGPVKPSLMFGTFN